MIDTHAHIYAEEFNEDRKDVIQRAHEAGLSHIVLANVDTESLPQVIETWKKEPDFFIPTIGLHPTSVDGDYKLKLAELEKEIAHYPFRAIGEIGLDLYWDKTYLEEQKEAFRIQAKWAAERNLPLIIHVRDAFPELHELLKELAPLHLRGVIHSFSGDAEDVRKIRMTGDFLFGINGIATFKKSTLPDVIREIGADHLVVETDAPYLAPVPFRGKRNEPAYVIHTAAKIAEILETDIRDIDRITSENAKKLFGIS